MGKEPRLETPEQGVRREGQPRDTGPVDGFVGYRVDLAIAEVKGLGLHVIERAGTSAAKNGKLIAGFIDGAVAHQGSVLHRAEGHSVPE